jgi:hypothetical protein
MTLAHILSYAMLSPLVLSQSGVSLVVTNTHGSFELRMQWSNDEESGGSGGTLRGIAQQNEDEVILHVVKA